MKVIVCDDDVTLRSVVTRLATEAGHTVLAETDSAADAVDMVLRFGAQVLVIDLALPWGAGSRAVRELREAGANCEIVVFTSWAADSPEVRAAGVRAVIEKPDFESLELVLADLAAGLAADTPAGADRRRPTEPRPTFPPRGSSGPSGLEDPATFADAANHLQACDAAVIVHVAGTVTGAGWYDRLTATDQVLSVARLVRSVLRAQDRLALDDPVGGEIGNDLVILLLGGGRSGVESLWRRLEKGHAAAALPGIINGGWSVVEEDLPAGFAIARARDGAHRSIGRPEGDRLWAG